MFDVANTESFDLFFFFKDFKPLMRNLIATCQLVVLVVLAISVMHEFRNAEAGRQARLKLLQTISAVESSTCQQAPPAQDGMVTLPNPTFHGSPDDVCHVAGGCVVTFPTT